MSEIKVKFASRYIKRKRTNAVGKSLLKTLAEPITNADDSYQRLKISAANQDGHSPIIIQVNAKNRMIKVIDNAEGMTKEDLKNKFEIYGSDKSGASLGYSVRGLFGQGIFDVLFYHSNGVIKSIKNKEAAICNFYEKHEEPFINVKKIDGSINNIAAKWGINCNHGTAVEFTLDKSTAIHSFDRLVNRLSSFYMLRMINSDDNRMVKLFYTDRRGRKHESAIKYFFPKGELVGHKEFLLPFEDYNPVKIDVNLYKSDEFLETIGEQQENGLLVFDNKKTVYDLTFFGLDGLPNTDKFYGFVKLINAREIIIDKINQKKHPEEILADSRDGFNKSHKFYKDLEKIMRDWLYPILSEQKNRKSVDNLSENTKEKQLKAFNKLSKLYSQLVDEDSSGVISSSKLKKSVYGGLEFARSNISITAKKKYGICLFIDTDIIKVGSKILLNSSKNKIGFTPTKIIVEKPKKNNILTKTINIRGLSPDTGDTLKAEFDRYNSSVVISIVPEEIFYPDNGIEFNPDYCRAIVNRESTLYLYVDLKKIKKGTKIQLSSSNDFIKLKDKQIILSKRMRGTKDLAKILVSFHGNKLSESGIIEATCVNYSAQARVDIRERINEKVQGSTGKFKGWDFDEAVGPPLQAAYDSNPTSSTHGFILINPNHPINQRYLGENPRKKDIETSLSAQLYLAELILNECLNVTIPEALQKGVLPRRLGDYDVLYYIAQKKFEYGPSIYECFVQEQSSNETKRNQQLQSISKIQRTSNKGVVNDDDLIEGMRDREKKIIEMRFGLNNQRPHTLDEIGNKYNITRERIRQIINSTFARKYGNYVYGKETDIKHDDIKKNERKITVAVEDILKAVSDFYVIKISDIKGDSRLAEFVRARQISIFLIRTLIGLSFSSIGRIFSRDHTTTLYAFEKIIDTMDQDNSLKNQIFSIKGIIYKGK